MLEKIPEVLKCQVTNYFINYYLSQVAVDLIFLKKPIIEVL